jgi:acetyl esterase/lipase
MSIEANFTKILLKVHFWRMYRQPYQKHPQIQEKFNRLTARIPQDILFEAASADGVPVEWVSDSQSRPEHVILYFHGGAYYAGSINTHRGFAAQFVKATGFRVLLVDYRLAPANPYPAAVEDATTAYRWLLAQGYSPSKIIVAGDSAGGGLSLATLVNLRDAGELLPAGAVCISPWTDLALKGKSMELNAQIDFICPPQMLEAAAPRYFGAHDPQEPLISPLYADLSGLPPILIHVGTEETLLDDATRLAEAAQKAGVDVDLQIWPDMFHIFVLVDYLPEAQAAMSIITKFVGQNTA